MLHYVDGIAAFVAGSSGQDAWGVGPAGESFGIASGGRHPAPKAERPTYVGFLLVFFDYCDIYNMFLVFWMIMINYNIINTYII